ncbi:response regulator [Carboxylicivirga sp. N1Y90]|uniref:response regulator n=1 Tax=Carboxylicivirga fragile TaxID=3417571 RepID=UPI003D345D12|nr:response regulator [Marinilabiliaceae bacterium N1Y90]
MNNDIKIMYVDDEELNLQLFKLNFNRKYEVIIAESGSAALEILEKHSDILIIISDMKMPIMTGIEFIKKAKVKYPHVKYYILTGYDITDEIQQALESNLILKYFRKPFNFNEIDNAIMSSIKK